MRNVLVKLYIDVLEVLQGDRIAGALFAFDTYSAHGSVHLGTDRLQTAVGPDDILNWAVSSLECEAYVNIVDLELPAWLRAERVTVRDRDYWRAHVVGTPEPATYAVTFAIGRYGKRMRHAGHLGFVPAVDESADLPVRPRASAEPITKQRRSREKGGAA